MKAKKFRSLELKARNLLSVYNSGNHLSNLIDNVEEKNSVKRFQSGDKKIDIKNSIKQREVMANTFDPEKQLDVYIILDISGSQETKNDTAMLLALYLLFLAEIADENVCLITFNDKVQEVPLSNDYAFARNILSNVLFKNTSNFSSSLDILLSNEPNNSLIFIISDFYIDMSKNVCNVIKAISSNNTIYPLVLREKQSDYGTCTVLDSENGQYATIDLSDVSYVQWQDNVKKMLIRLNCLPICIDVASKNPLLPLIRKLL